MNDDRELLELAAKAAGYTINWCYRRDEGRHGSYYNTTTGGYWNPLTDDGDAFRLAVRLFFTTKMNIGMVSVISDQVPNQHEYFGNDPYAATRRSIVRAAAEIGKEMK